MIQDLAAFHQPIGDLFPQPKSADEWSRYRLTEDQVAFFEERGYLAGVDLLTPRQVESLRAELAEFFDPGHAGKELWYEYHTNESPDPSRVLFHALGAWRIRPGFHDLLWDPAFVVSASQLLGGAVRFWHDQLFCKPARHGGVVAWHQDYSYWTRTQPIAHLSCWIALDDATRENGCIQYVPGSHRWPLLPVTGLAGDMNAIQSVLDEEQRAAFRPVAVELRAGQGCFHHPLLVHGSYENRTDGPRRAAVLNVFRDGVRSNDDTPPLDGVPAIPKGQPMGGRFFPLLFDSGGCLS